MRKRMILMAGIMVLLFCACNRSEDENSREQTNNVENILINWEGSCKIFDTEVENIIGIVSDIEALAWIAPRGGAGIISEGREIKENENEYITQSNMFLSNETDICLNDSSEIWIRVVRTPVPAQTGTTESGYKDIIVYKQDDNACLAVQSSEIKECGHYGNCRNMVYG